MIDVENFIQNHELLGAQLAGHAEWMKTISSRGKELLKEKSSVDVELLQKRLFDLQKQYDE